MNIYHPTQIAGGGDPLAQQQTPSIQPRLVGQTVSRFQRGHQGDPAAYCHGGQCLIGIDPDQGLRCHRLLVEGAHPQQQPDKFIPLGLCTLQLCGYHVARLIAQPLQPGQPIGKIGLHPEDAEQEKQPPPGTAICKGDQQGQQQAPPCE